MIVTLLVSTARADCDAASLQQAVDRAETAFVEMDQGGFVAAATSARSTLGCVDDALSPVQIAGFHRMCALEAYLGGDHAGATLYFQSVRGTQPGYTLPLEIAPEGHPLRDDFDRSTQYGTDGRFDLPTPVEGWLTVDGQRGSSAPAGRPFVLQWFAETGEVELTSWVSVGAPLPSFPTAKVGPAPTPSPQPVQVAENQHRSGTGLIIAGLTSAVIGGALYGGAFVVRGNYNEAVAVGDRARLHRAHTTVNAMTIAGGALLGGGATLTLVGVF